MIGNRKLIGTSIITALTASICCVMPVLAIFAGTAGLASTFSWLAPFRPYLIGIAVIAIGYAWYDYLKPKKSRGLL